MRTCPLNSSLLFLNWLRLIWMALDVGGGDSDRPPPIKSRCLIRSKCEILIWSRCFPLYTRKRTQVSITP